MSITFPNYVRANVVPSTPVAYEWDDETTDVFLDDARLAKRIGAATARGIAALSVGCAEWIVYRFSGLSDDPMPYQYLEAAWAGIIDWNLMKIPHGAKLKDWKGSVRRPLFLAIRTLKENLSLASSGDYPAEETVHLVFLARYVLPDPKPFMKWLDSAIGRLETYYSGDGMGEPVPREVLDPDFDFKPEQAKELLEEYLRTVASSGNPYLNLPHTP
ncbi:hypothetical protein [Myxococcus sp. Y35]|uniref:hypothetical protein n=1 Tax=Pseudomyxococcus flavus TaxID=3115648 RepID=UPI003CF9E128